MLTNKNPTMIDEKKLDKHEAWYFIRCMEDELQRHKTAQSTASKMVQITTSIVTKRFYEYSITRHKEDMDMIKKTINYLQRKWKI